VTFAVGCLLAASLLRAQKAESPKPPPRPAVPPTHSDVKYGPHERNVMDVWLAAADRPTPVVVSIHGGAFRHGDKSVSNVVLRESLASGISVVAITYRFSAQAVAPAQHLDAARAIQFIRHQATDWNLDPSRIAATGGSAGAGLSMWLGFHDDLADPDNEDPVLRQSTRLTCMAVNNGQSSYDPRFIRDLFPGSDTYRTSALAELFGVDLRKLDELPEEKYQLFAEVSAITHLTADDAPVLMTYNSEFDTPISTRSIGIHHPRFAKVLKEKMDPLGIECRVEPGIPCGDRRRSKLTMAFIKRHLAPDPVVEENIAYRRAGETELNLDLAQPAGNGPFPALVFIHGGGWYTGSRRGYRSQIEEAARRGYVAITISYRLMQFDEAEKESTTASPIFPAQLHDAKAAIRWLRANAEKYRIDSARIGVTGRSAGGHLSLLLGLTDTRSQLEGSSGNEAESSRVQAVVNVFGPTDMEACFKTSSVAWIFRLFLGGSPEEATKTYAAASPVTHASADDPPVLTLHGDRDRAVPISQAKALDQAMQAAGASHTLRVFEDQEHGFGGAFRRRELDAMWGFFEQHLKP
jgi:acetyl esterase